MKDILEYFSKDPVEHKFDVNKRNVELLKLIMQLLNVADCETIPEKIIDLKTQNAELLEALKETTERLRLLKEVTETHTFDDEGYITVHKSLIWDDNDQNAFDKARAAIKKVENVLDNENV